MLKGLLDRTDVTNFAAVIAVLVYVGIVTVHAYIALNSSEPTQAIKDLIQWAMPVFLGILQTYGIIKNK